jgi:uncharacterized OB-fold protein
MNDFLKNIEPMVYESRINVPYHWWAGETASTFLTALRDEKRIMGLRCQKCSRVYIPPRKVCPICFTENSEWVPLSEKGVVRSFTVARRNLKALPKKPPVIFGLIQLDGADTALLHFIDGIEPERVAIGIRVEAQFAKNRSGTIRDIDYFKPV